MTTEDRQRYEEIAKKIMSEVSYTEPPFPMRKQQQIIALTTDALSTLAEEISHSSKLSNNILIDKLVEKDKRIEELEGVLESIKETNQRNYNAWNLADSKNQSLTEALRLAVEGLKQISEDKEFTHTISKESSDGYRFVRKVWYVKFAEEILQHPVIKELSND